MDNIQQFRNMLIKSVTTSMSLKDGFNTNPIVQKYLPNITRSEEKVGESDIDVSSIPIFIKTFLICIALIIACVCCYKTKCWRISSGNTLPMLSSESTSSVELDGRLQRRVDSLRQQRRMSPAAISVKSILNPLPILKPIIRPIFPTFCVYNPLKQDFRQVVQFQNLRVNINNRSMTDMHQ